MTGEFLTVFTDLLNWLTQTALPSAEALFYNDAKLTFIGNVSIIAVAFGAGLLVINKIADFVRLR